MTHNQAATREDIERMHRMLDHQIRDLRHDVHVLHAETGTQKLDILRHFDSANEHMRRYLIEILENAMRMLNHATAENETHRLRLEREKKKKTD